MSVRTIAKQVFRPLKGLQIFVVVVYGLENIFVVLQPYFMGKLIDSLHIGIDELLRLAVYVTMFVALEFLLNWYQNYLWFKMIYKGVFLLRSTIFEKVIDNSLNFFVKNKAGDIVNKVMNDVAQYAEKTLITLPMLLMNLLTLAVVFGMIFSLEIKIGIVLFIICILYFLSYRYINMQLRRLSGEERNSYSELLHNTSRLYEGIPTIKLFHREDLFAMSYRDMAKKLCEKSITLQRWKSLAICLSSMIISLMPVIAVVLGVYLISRGKCTVGAVFSIYSYIALLGEPIRNLTDYNILLQQGAVNERRIDSILANNINISKQNITLKTKTKYVINELREIMLEDVGFAYEGQENILKQFNMQLKRGEKIGVIGSSGSGKSTLVRLITGQISPASGLIKINGIPLQNIDNNGYLNRVAVMPQDIFLYEDSIENNILFKRSIGGNILEKVKKELGISLYEKQKVDELSGGEKRRIGLARALVGDFDLLILDEPTSDIDEKIEKKIITFIEELLKQDDKMLIVITHRPAILEICSKVISL